MTGSNGTDMDGDYRQVAELVIIQVWLEWCFSATWPVHEGYRSRETSWGMKPVVRLER